MRKTLSFCMLLLLCQPGTFAQTAYKIAGAIWTSERKNEPAYLASIFVARQADTARAAYTGYADSLGQFQASLTESGQYLLRISLIGYKTYQQSFVVSDTLSGFLRLNDIVLERDPGVMKTVVVQSKRPLLEYRADRLILNVSNSVLAETGSAFDLMRRVPGLYIDNNNSFSLKGKPGVLVLLDGKPTNMTGNDLAAFLMSTAGSMVERIEVMTNPPSGMDARGTGGAINIVTKRLKKAGWNIGLSSGYGIGVFAKTNSGITFNYRYNRFSALVSVTHNFSKTSHLFNTERFSKDVSGERRFFQDAEALTKRYGWMAKTFLDYNISKKSSIGGMLTFFGSKMREPITSLTSITQNNTTLQESISRATQIRADGKSIIANLNFRRTDIGSRKGTFSVDADLYDYRLDGLSAYEVVATGPSIAEQYIFRNLSPNNVFIRSAKADYSQPLTGPWKIDMGLKYSSIFTRNSFGLDSFRNNAWVPVKEQTNTFNYDERIGAAYVSVSGEIDSSLQIQTGLRLEHTKSAGISWLPGGKAEINRNYINLFPTLFVTKTLNEKNQLSFSFSRRINRPNYESLNPFIIYVDKYDISQGNPNLEPAYTNSAELSYLLRMQYSISIGFSDTRKHFQPVVLLDPGTNITSEISQNIDHYYNYYASAALPFNITKWWESFYFTNISYRDYRASFTNNKGWVVQFYTENNFELPRNYSFFVSYNYLYAQAFSLFRARPYGYVDFSMRKTSKDKKLSVSFRVSDIFRTNRTVATARYDAVNQQVVNQYEGRIFRFNISYRFGKALKELKERRTASEEERRRVGK